MKAEIIDAYMQRVQAVFATGETTEHSFRPALEFLFKNITGEVSVINEPKMVTDVGRPDFAFKRKVGANYITIGHCEAKDIDKGIDPRAMRDGNKNQYSRYIKGLPNLIYTNGLDFRFYVKGELIREVTIGDYYAHELKARKRNYHALTEALKEFVAERLQTITSAKRLAELMAGKAVLIKTVLGNSLKDDIELNTELVGQYKAFKEQLIHDLTPESFADIYAETVAYGMFAARLHDETLENFSREEALELLPKSNPFLRNLFSYVAGPTLDERIKRDIDELAEIFQATDLQKLFADFGQFTKRNDPFIHFYETFLAEYNPKKRKARGVWYTPEPVVNFIVRAVDDVLKTEFGLPMGLADTSKITVDVDTGQTKTARGKAKPVIEKREMHRVQILDPATGTGTFLAEVIKQIAPKIKGVAPGQWSSYVEKEMIPRIHGFELLMASYAMCHMKLDMMLKEMDYVPTDKPPRLSVYLTNSLEEGDKEVRDLFMAQWLSNEAKAASEVKRDKPIMCIIGNPPYSVSSQNKGKWIQSLLARYKKGLNERKINLDDDYIKFIRLSEHLIAKNEEGVLAMITNNSFLKGVTHRKMRLSLLETFDKCYVIDLHGDSNQLERSPDGSADQNVFDIMQGVSISIFIKKKNKSREPSSNPDETVFHHMDMYGTRSFKNNQLFKLSVAAKSFKRRVAISPYYFLTPHDVSGQKQYDLGFKINEFFASYNTGIQTKRDHLCLRENINDAQMLLEDTRLLDESEFRKKYSPGEDTGGWKLSSFLADASKSDVSSKEILYRPFDILATLYSGRSGGVLGRPRNSIMRHMLKGENLALLCGRQNKSGSNNDFLVTSLISEMKSAERTIQSYQFPLYLYPEEGSLDQSRRVNMDPKIRAAIEKAATDTRGTPDEVAIFDYIYGVLHCPAYRETYAEFLKIDFPRIPYPSSPEAFWDISAKGTELR